MQKIGRRKLVRTSSTAFQPSEHAAVELSRSVPGSLSGRSAEISACGCDFFSFIAFFPYTTNKRQAVLSVVDSATAPGEHNAYAGAIDHVSAEITRTMAWVQTFVSMPFLNAFVIVDLSFSEFP
jgi:hypothetical protein